MVHERALFIGTEEKLLYMVDSDNFQILDRMPCQSYVFTIELIGSQTIVCGQYQGFIDIIKFNVDNQEMIKIQ